MILPATHENGLQVRIHIYTAGPTWVPPGPDGPRSRTVGDLPHGWPAADGDADVTVACLLGHPPPPPQKSARASRSIC